MKDYSELDVLLNKIKFSELHSDIIQAVKNNDLNSVKAAIRQNPKSVNDRDNSARTPAMYAAMMGNTNILNYLSFQDGVDLEAIDNENNDIMYYCFWSGSETMIRYVFQLLHPTDSR